MNMSKVLITFTIMLLSFTCQARVTSTAAVKSIRADIEKPTNFTNMERYTSGSNFCFSKKYEVGGLRYNSNTRSFEDIEPKYNTCLPIINRIDNTCFISIFYRYDGDKDKYGINIRNGEVAYYLLFRGLKAVGVDIDLLSPDKNGQCSIRKQIYTGHLPLNTGLKCKQDKNGNHSCGYWQ